MQTAIQRRWLALSDTERKLARRTVDWQHNHSQMSDADRDEAYDYAMLYQEVKLSSEQMRVLEVSAAHTASGAIMCLDRIIWFNMNDE